MFNIEYLRSFRIGEYAMFDLAVSFIGIYLLSPLLSKLFLKFKIKIPTISWMYFTLPIGILAHLAVSNITKMTANFIDPNGHFVLKTFILGLTYLGIKNIKHYRI